jgi:hypothetical protein
MKSHLFATFGAIMLMIATSACTSSGNGQISTSAVSGTKSQDTLCYQTTAYRPLPKSGTRRVPTPDAFKGPIVGKARSYQDFYRGLLTFQTKLNEVYDIDAYTAINRSPAEIPITQYLRDELYGKHISGWEGWIVQTGLQATEDAPYAIDSYDYSKAVLISMSDPFTTTIPLPVTGNNDRDLPQLNSPYVIVANASGSSGQQLCLGQKVTIDGDVNLLPTFSFVNSEITLPAATLTIQEDKIAGHIATPAMKDVTIDFKGISGWTGDVTFESDLYGDGTLLYFGSYYEKVKGYRIANIGEAKVQQIVAAFDKAGFDSMQDYSDGCCDFGTDYITLTRGNSVKQVAHNGGNGSAPMELAELENQLYGLMLTEGWIK